MTKVKVVRRENEKKRGNLQKWEKRRIIINGCLHNPYSSPLFHCMSALTDMDKSRSYVRR